MIPNKRFLATALLDFLCCGLGAAAVLLIISATTRLDRNPPAGARSLVVRGIRGNDSPPAEVGIEYRSPTSDVWRSLPDDPSIRFSAPSDSDSGGEAFLILNDPEPGTWQFRPYLRDFPEISPAKLASSVTVSLQFWGQYRKISRDSSGTKMVLPGDHGSVVEVRIPVLKHND